MRRLALAFLFLLFLVPSFLVPSLQGQTLGNRYFHCDTLNVTTTARDCTWTNEWEVATIYSDSVDVDMRIGAPDVSSWSSRNWMRLQDGSSLMIGPTPSLKKITVKTTTGTGILYIIGYKKVRQY